MRKKKTLSANSIQDSASVKPSTCDVTHRTGHSTDFSLLSFLRLLSLFKSPPVVRLIIPLLVSITR